MLVNNFNGNDDVDGEDDGELAKDCYVIDRYCYQKNIIAWNRQVSC